MSAMYLHKPPFIQNKHCLYPPNRSDWKCKIAKILVWKQRTAGPRDLTWTWNWYNKDNRRTACKYIYLRKLSMIFNECLHIYMLERRGRVIDPSLNLDNDTDLCRLPLLPAALQDCVNIVSIPCRVSAAAVETYLTPHPANHCLPRNLFCCCLSSLSSLEQSDTFVWTDWSLRKRCRLG